MVVSSGDIGRPYEVIDLVTAYATSDEKFSGKISGGEAYRASIERLKQAALNLKADAAHLRESARQYGCKARLCGRGTHV